MQEKNMEKPKSKSAKSKKHKSKIKGEKQESQKGQKKMTCPFAFVLRLYCFLDVLFFAFILYLFCFLPGKNANKRKQTNRKSTINAKKMQMSIFSHCFFPFCFSFFSPLILHPFFFFSFEVLLFEFPCVLLFLHVFQV